MKHAALTAILLATPLIAAEPAPAAPTVEQLQAEFRKLGFGMFIHYNMATYHGKQWVDGYPRTDVKLRQGGYRMVGL